MRNVLVICLLILGANLYAEFTNPFDDQTVQTPQSPQQSFNSGNSIVDSRVNAALVDASGITYDTENDGRGREYKAASSESDSGKGKNAAAAAGAALISSGIPLLGNIFTIPEGITLITMGGIELAQAGASAGTEQQNKSQKDLLLYNEDAPQSQLNNGLSDQDREALKSQLRQPELENFLAERGVNSDNFLDQLVGGQLTNFADVQNALGDFTQFSPEDLANARGLAEEKFASLTNNGNDLGFNEGAGSQDALYPGGFGGGNGATSDLPGASGANASTSAERGIASIQKGKGVGQNSASDSASGVAQKGDFGKLFGKVLAEGAAAASSLASLPISALHKFGIFRGSRHMNIFAKARMQYQSFRHDQDLAHRD